MTITRTDNRWTASGNGTTTAFDIDEHIEASSHVVVYLINNSTSVIDLQTEGSEYTVSGVGDASGATVDFVIAPASGYTVLIRRVLPLTQPAGIRNLGRFDAGIHEDAFDRLLQQIQQMQEQIDRSIRGSVMEDTVAEMPAASIRSSKYLRMDATGLIPQFVAGEPSDPLSVYVQTDSAIDGQTVINTTYPYTPGTSTLAFYRGSVGLTGMLRQTLGVDYTETDGDTITTTTPMVAGTRYLIEIGAIRDVTLLQPVRREQFFILAEGQTDIVLTEFTYNIDNHEVLLILNGAVQTPDAYTETNSTTLTLLTAAQDGDSAYVIVGQGFDSAGSGTSTGFFAQSDQEAAASITPTDYSYTWGHVFRYGAVNDGLNPDTAAFDRMLACHPGSAFVPYTGTRYVIGRLFIPSHTRLTLEPGVVLEDSGGLTVSQSLVEIDGVHDVEIVGWGAAVTQNNMYGSGLNRNGVRINGGTTIKISGLAVNACDGNGYYITGNAERIQFYGCIAQLNRNYNLGIVSTDGFLDISGYYSGSISGGGVAISPAAVTDLLINVKFYKTRCWSNYTNGIFLNLAAYNSNNILDVRFDGPHTALNCEIDTSSYAGIRLIGAAAGSTALGAVHIIDAVCQDENVGSISVSAWNPGVTLDIVRPRIINPNQSEHVSGAALRVSQVTGATYGSIVIDNPAIDDTDGFLNGTGIAAIAVDGLNGAGTIRVVNPVLRGVGEMFDVIDGSNNVLVEYSRPRRVQLAGTSTTLSVVRNNPGVVFHNDGLGALHTVNLPSISGSNDIGMEYEFEVMEAQYIVLDGYSTNAFRPGGTTTWRSNTVGSRVRIRAVESGFWHIILQIGTWAV